ncbi:hypothetical protein D9M68_400250 [compost metagenome]
MHRAALPLGKTAATTGKFGHDATSAHAAGQHVAMVTIGGDNLITVFQCHLHADDNSLLADVEVTEAADETHAIELAGLFLETPDEQHFAVSLQVIFFGEIGDGAAVEVLLGRLCGGLTAGDGRGFSRSHSFLPMVSLWRLP